MLRVTSSVLVHRYRRSGVVPRSPTRRRSQTAHHRRVDNLRKGHTWVNRRRTLDDRLRRPPTPRHDRSDGVHSPGWLSAVTADATRRPACSTCWVCHQWTLGRDLCVSTTLALWDRRRFSPTMQRGRRPRTRSIGAHVLVVREEGVSEVEDRVVGEPVVGECLFDLRPHRRMQPQVLAPFAGSNAGSQSVSLERHYADLSHGAR